MPGFFFFALKNPGFLKTFYVVCLETVATGFVVCFVYTKTAAAHFLFVKSGYSCSCSVGALHFYKTETLRLSAIAVDDNVYTFYIAVGLEKVLKFVFGGVVVHVAYINFVISHR